MFSVVPEVLISVESVSLVSTLQDSRIRRCRFPVGQCLECLSLEYELWNCTRVRECPVLFQCVYHVSCDRIVGLSWSSTPLVGSDMQHCVSCLLGLRIPRILRSCPSHPKCLREFLCSCSNRSLGCVALLASELPLDCPHHAEPMVYLSCSC